MLATTALSASLALWTVELSSGTPLLAPGFTTVTWMAGMLLTVAWLVTSQERRLARRLQGIEGARYRDGYAAGYLDAVNQRQTAQYERERPSLRPVR
jgi:hypothetical protein